MANLLYYGDNLEVLREHIRDQSVDLIYLDPPFNSNATYNVLFRSPSGDASQAQIEVFEDTWHWNNAAENAFDQVMFGPNADVADMLRAMRSFLKDNDMMAYGLLDAHGRAARGTASRLEADRLDLPALRPDRKPLSQGADGCGVRS
jgi:adenine specific DNA methylase Mod